MERLELDVELKDGTEHVIRITNPSMVAFDRARATRDWPSSEDAPILWMTFLAWHHMKAAGLISCDLKQFETTECVAVQVHGAARKGKKGRKAKSVDPTRPTVVSIGSSDSPSPSAPSPQAEFLG